MSNSWEIATWRFEMISALLDPNLTEAQKRRIVRERTTRALQWPNSPQLRPIGKSTLFRWLKNYREKGFLGLMPKVRKDKGRPRSERSNYVNYALGLLYEQPERSLTQLMLYLELEFGKLSYSRSTLSRDLHAHPAFAGIFQYLTAVDPLSDLIDNDGDGLGVDISGNGILDVNEIDEDELKVPGRININTAPWFVIAQLPWMMPAIVPRWIASSTSGTR